MTIRIPDDLARGLQDIAEAQNTSVEQLALERLRSLIDNAGAPETLLRAIRRLSHASPAAVDELDAAIATSKLPVRDQSAFDR